MARPQPLVSPAHAQSQLGDIVYVEVPQLGASEKGSDAAVVDRSRRRRMSAPVTGTVTEGNGAPKLRAGPIPKEMAGSSSSSVRPVRA